jgi:hypothetical protein
MNELPAGPFVLAAGGPWPREWSKAITQMAMDFIRSNPQLISQAYGLETMSDDIQRKIVEAQMAAMSGVQSTAFCLRPATDEDLFFGQVLSVSLVDNSTTYLQSLKKTTADVRKVIADAGGDIATQPDLTDEEVAGKGGLKMVVDLAAALGDDDNARGMIEMMFGGSSEITSYIGVADEKRVASLFGSKKALEETIASIRAGGKTLAADTMLAKTTALMPSDAPWVAYISPRGTVAWIRGMVENFLGGMGGPEIPDFPETPPIGISIRFVDGRLAADMIVPADMIAGLVEYIQTVSEL